MLNVNLLKLVVVSALAVVTTTMTMTTTTVYAQNQTTTNATGTNVTTTTNATGTNVTTTTPANATIVTTLILYPGKVWESPLNSESEEVIQLSPQNIQYQQTDPGFAKLAQVTADCLNKYNALFHSVQSANVTDEDSNSQKLCIDIIVQGLTQFCESTDFATFDIQKCEEARAMTQRYLAETGRFFG
jgi:hypothetical protein